MAELNFTTISEQTGNIQVPFASDIDINEITKGDKDPMFVVVEALNDEKPSKNGRYYDKTILESVAEQVNRLKPDAYQGHLDDKDRPFKNPDSQTIWLGAKVFNIKGVNRLFIKGYVLPDAKYRRSYLKTAKAVGKSVYVSIYGTAKDVYDKARDAMRIVVLQLESIDWARSGSAGMDTLGILGVTREMSNDTAKVLVENHVKDRLKNQKYGVQVFVTSEVLKEMSDNLYDSEKVDSIINRVTCSKPFKELQGNVGVVNPTNPSGNTRRFTTIESK